MILRFLSVRGCELVDAVADRLQARGAGCSVRGGAAAGLGVLQQAAGDTGHVQAVLIMPS